ncbi:hypothetical protein J2129_002007 [Methanofollis sp. W23]|nr:hypothetical protein [Methanofollis sp. W23]
MNNYRTGDDGIQRNRTQNNGHMVVEVAIL